MKMDGHPAAVVAESHMAGVAAEDHTTAATAELHTRGTAVPGGTEPSGRTATAAAELLRLGAASLVLLGGVEPKDN
ncbi:hypothetical protein GUJ93_ZPchr0006g45555 [Zizania palustris]|uniref:Uncharacterized protein n=1 Tax=Zizania palustris TaxID=103762 RepID=A0A8J5TA61_ZIZPA|nr:hypothetical protein GUJ93_ZPchr0006g45555 [Zizania palustris]